MADTNNSTSYNKVDSYHPKLPEHRGKQVGGKCRCGKNVKEWPKMAMELVTPAFFWDKHPATNVLFCILFSMNAPAGFPPIYFGFTKE